MSRFRRFAAAFLGIVGWCWFVWQPLARAAVPTAEDLGLDDQIVDVWETAHGMPQGTVTAITRTRDGYLWVGTRTRQGASRSGLHGGTASRAGCR